MKVVLITVGALQFEGHFDQNHSFGCCSLVHSFLVRCSTAAAAAMHSSPKADFRTTRARLAGSSRDPLGGLGRRRDLVTVAA